MTKLEKISVKNLNEDDFVKQRARGAYIAYIALADLSFEFSRAAQRIKPN